MCIACGALFRHILKEVRVCFLSYVCNKRNFLHLDVQTRFQPFSIQSLHERVLEFEVLTIVTRKLRVKKVHMSPAYVIISVVCFLLERPRPVQFLFENVHIFYLFNKKLRKAHESVKKQTLYTPPCL